MPDRNHHNPLSRAHEAITATEHAWPKPTSAAAWAIILLTILA